MYSPNRTFYLYRPGAYELGVSYLKQSYSEGSGGRTYTTTESDKIINVNYNLVAGRYYSLSADVGSNAIQFFIKEETDQAKINAAKEVVSKAKVSAPSQWSAGYVTTDPTKFEGVWVTPDSSGKYGSITMAFSGNTYVLLYKETPKNSQRGNFSYTDDGLTLYMTRGYSGNNANSVDIGTALSNEAGWLDLSIAKTKLNYTYTLNGDTLELFYGKTLVAALRKQ